MSQVARSFEEPVATYLCDKCGFTQQPWGQTHNAAEVSNYRSLPGYPFLMIRDMHLAAYAFFI